mgnify:CR=1 FL=1
MDVMNEELAPLTNKQQRFVDEYLVDLNAAAAAIRAGYRAKNADVVGSQNLAKPNVAAAIRERIADRRQRTEITQDRVLEELAHIAFARAGDVMEWGETTVRRTEADGEIKETVCHGLKVRKSADLPPEVMAAVAEVSEGKNGLQVKLHGKVQALTLLGMFVDRAEISGRDGAPIVISDAERAAKIAGLVALAQARKDGDG